MSLYRVFKETEELRDTINTTLKQTLKIQEEALVQQKESYQSTLASKAELLKDREDKIQSLLSEIEQNKAVWENEKKDLLLKLEEKKTAVKEEEKKEAIRKFADYAALKVPTARNMRGSADYRTLLVRVLTRRALEAVGGMTDEN